MQRREREVRGGSERELEKVKEDRKCFEWVRLRRESRRRKGRVRRGGEWGAWLQTGYAGLTDRMGVGGGEAALEERTQWRRGCISSTSQANYSAANPLFYLSPAFLLSPCPLLSLSLSLLALTFSICALTIHVLSAATDPYMIPVCTGRFYLPLLQ